MEPQETEEYAIWRNISSMEPLLPDGSRRSLADLTEGIRFEAGRLSGSGMPQKTREGIEKIVQQMNSYYSNLIEGHKTSPLEVEKALRKDFDHDPKKRALQQLGVAHIETEEHLKTLLRDEPETDTFSSDFIKMVHREFYNRLPKELRVVKDSKDREYPLIPGEFRSYNVNVHYHVPPDYPCLENFMGRFESFYGSERILSTRKLVAIAASHQRFLWIHPFGDGNGRVARLLSHASLIQCGLGGYGLWTLARGLARSRDDYYRHLNVADQTRKNDYDGRGNLSSDYLGKFCEFFLQTILDQMSFMTSVLEYSSLKHRIENYVYRNDVFGKHNAQGVYLLLEALHEGEYARGEATRLTGYGETIARELLQTALGRGLLASDGPRSPVYLGFPSDVLEDYFPKLFMPSV
ncbi:MAG: Fic family protein [Verrucomicrobia bacterium]|jgi:Fic family protein|nr:Fic family protein [Verrucomicrobiota bacterium]MBT7065921.1 Fic family protein [Verrucomicrobiota bacterium]MBT7699439.1 Fic family protein [Verrucomicrobiota bacterium]